MQNINLKEFEALVDKWLMGKLDAQEYLLFYRYLKQDGHQQILADILESQAKKHSEITYSTPDWEQLYLQISSHTKTSIPFNWKYWLPLAAAAVLVIVCSLFIFIKPDQHQTKDIPLQKMTAPTSSVFVVNDSKGRQKQWDSKNEQIQYHDLLMKGNLLVVMPSTNEVINYSIVNPIGSAPLAMQLSDGTKLHINAGSSIEFPSHFTTIERRVSMQGEILFEVAPDKNHPFILNADQLSIQVLGTTFNVKSFKEDTRMETTLLEGKINVKHPSGQSLTLRPGEQAIYDKQKGHLIRNQVDATHVLAWKNSKLILDDESLVSVLQKIERLYGIKCSYDPTFKDVPIWGSISTKDSLNDILQMLEKVSGVKLKLTGKTIMVSPL